MMNHKYPKQTNWTYDDKKGAFVVKALEDIWQGAEVSTCYRKSVNNYESFLYFGYVSDQSVRDHVNVRLSLDKDDPMYDEKKEEVLPQFHQ